MDYDEYMAKRCELFNRREKGFQIIAQADHEIKELDAQYKRDHWLTNMYARFKMNRIFNK